MVNLKDKVSTQKYSYIRLGLKGRVKWRIRWKINGATRKYVQSSDVLNHVMERLDV